jgi:hypothetical protein
MSLSTAPHSCLVSQFFSPLDTNACFKPSDPRTQLGFLWNTCPLIKQVLTVSSEYTFNYRYNMASVNSHNNTDNISVPPTVALQSLPVRQKVFRSNYYNYN